ncbi:hypothetical protein NDU88_009206 [Pleurodeles waltl]|uniref:Uncharacterized protein n=1 Tax=Pleurodeles waltl TaxID=8319 RepID=A0AAV7PRS7_PLEWA|nr:hypothetical protein NDU88_009206 [Pleurodeles waltl]
MAATGGMPTTGHTSAHSDTAQDPTMERILQEITALAHRIKGLDTTISTLVAKTKSIHQDIAGFQNRVHGVRTASLICGGPSQFDARKQPELLFLHGKVTDLENRSRKNDDKFWGFLEQLGVTSVTTFLR